MLLRAYALTVGLRKDRKVLTTVVRATKQENWSLRGEGLGWGASREAPGGTRQGHVELVAEADEKGKGFQGAPLGSAKSTPVDSPDGPEAQVSESARAPGGRQEDRGGGAQGGFSGESQGPHRLSGGAFEGSYESSRVRRSFRVVSGTRCAWGSR